MKICLQTALASGIRESYAAAHRYSPVAMRQSPMMGLYRGSEQEEILKEGTRILLVKKPPDIFIRLKPRPEDRVRVEEAIRPLDKLEGQKR